MSDDIHFADTDQISRLPEDARCPGCRNPIVGVAPWPCGGGYGYGYSTVSNDDGRFCCSHMEGDFDTAESAQEQCALTVDWIVDQQGLSHGAPSDEEGSDYDAGYAHAAGYPT